ncbi:MAG TPA: non-canonical purine NTP pyrophosphatase [Gemmatimonadales bacterium]
MTSKLLVATRSSGKQREIRPLLADIPHHIVFPEEHGIWPDVAEDALEDTGSFEGNARRKAEYFAKRSGLPTVAEDSGLEVFALGGEPGVRSRRFALPTADPNDQDEANNNELLRRLAGAPEARRRGRYRCVVVFLDRHDGVPHVFEGACAGRILDRRMGSGGFGYDPLFFADDLGKSFGDASQQEKDSVSHRGRAFRALVEWIQSRAP